MMKGVAVTISGVRVGMGVQTGNGCGGAPHVSQAARKSEQRRRKSAFFMNLLYSQVILRDKLDKRSFVVWEALTLIGDALRLIIVVTAVWVVFPSLESESYMSGKSNPAERPACP